MNGKDQNFTWLNNCKCLMTPRLKSLPWLHLCRQCSKEHANGSPAASWCLEFQNTDFNAQYFYSPKLADCIRIVFNRVTHLHGTGYAVPWGLWQLCRSSGNSSSPFCQCQSAETWGVLYYQATTISRNFAWNKGLGQRDSAWLCDPLWFNLRALSWENTSHFKMHLRNSLRTWGLTGTGLSVTKMHPMRTNELHGATSANLHQSSIQNRCIQMHPVFDPIDFH